ncbi:MAG: penicillin-binding protein [Bacteroidota bacterium]
MYAKKDILWRVYLLYFMICLFGLGIIYKVFQIQVIEGNELRAKADTLTTDYRDIEAVRGNIYADDGSLLATSIPIYEIRMDMNIDALTDEIFYKKVDSLAFCLAKLFKRKSGERGDKTVTQYRRELINARREGERYHLIKRGVTYNELTQLREFPLFRLGRFKGGFIDIQKNKREKPFKLLAERTIGYEKENVRPVGLEGAYSKYLKGVGGKRLMQKISGGIWKPINNDNEIEPKDGCDIITTIDIKIQDVAENALKKQLIINSADHGCVILMEVETGEIKAIANLKKSELGVYYEGYNYAVGESTEPGSTFKLASLMAAIEDGLVDLDDTVDTEDGTKKYYDKVMRDSHKGGYGIITTLEAFEKSSNVGISKIISRSYSKDPQKFIDRLYKMNLNEKLDIDIEGEGIPRIKNPKGKDWSGITLPWMSVGYEVTQTPLQILTFYNAVANGGKMVKPLFVKEIRRKGKFIRSFGIVTINESICSELTIKKAKIMLESVIMTGTAKNLSNATYKIAGKTGTVQIANEKYGYRYKGKFSYQASFVGYFPADNPKYSCIVVVNAPSNEVYYGNLVAGPIFKEIADKVYATCLKIHPDLSEQTDIMIASAPYSKYGFQKDLQKVFHELEVPVISQNINTKWVVTSSRDSCVNFSVRRIEEELRNRIIPNVVGMAVQDAVYLLENAGLKVKIIGGGIIVRQSIEPGTRIYKRSEIILQLS